MPDAPGRETGRARERERGGVIKILHKRNGDPVGINPDKVISVIVSYKDEGPQTFVVLDERPATKVVGVQGMVAEVVAALNRQPGKRGRR